MAPATVPATPVARMVEAGAPLEEPELNDEHLLLRHAGNPRELAIFSELLRHPQDVDRRDKDGENALAQACLERLTKGAVKLDPSLDCPNLVTRWRIWIPARWKVEARA